MENKIMNFWKLAFDMADKLKEMNGYDKYLYIHEVLVDENLNETGYTVFKFYKGNKLKDELRLRRW